MNFASTLPLYHSDAPLEPDYAAVNRDLAEVVFSTIEANGFIPCNARFGDTYFIFSSEPNSRISFHIRNLPMPGWLFGIWIDSPALFIGEIDGDTPVIQLFAQHTNKIDKFKPSDSPFLVQWDKDTVLKFLDEPDGMLPVYDLREMLHMLSSHPFVSYGMDYPDDSFIGHPMREFFEDTFYGKFHEVDSKVKISAYGKWAQAKAKQLNRLEGVKASVRIPSEEGWWSSDGAVQLTVEIDPDVYTEDEAAEIAERFLNGNNLGKIHRDYRGEWDVACGVFIRHGERDIIFEE